MKKLILIVSVLSFNICAAPVQLAPKPNAWTKNTEPAQSDIKTTYSFMQSMDGKTIPADTIVGSCVYKEASCNGARITLTRDGGIIYETNITGGEFRIPNLKPGMMYELGIVWEKHKLTDKVKISSGQFVQLNMGK